MKRLLSILLLTLLILTACSTNSEDINTSNETYEIKVGDSTAVVEQSKDSATFESEYSLDDFVNLSSNIVKCRIEGFSEFDKNIFIYEATIIEELKGEIIDLPFTFYADNNYDLNKEYVLFLEFFDSALYGHRVYKPIIFASTDEENIFSYYTTDDKVQLSYDEESATANYSSLKQFVKKVDNGLKTNKSTVESNIIYTDDFDVLIENSDYICQIVPVELIASNPVLNYMKCKITKNYKNKLKEDILIFLPSDSKIGEEYLVFLFESSEGVYEINSLISFIAKTEEKTFNKVLNKLVKQ